MEQLEPESQSNSARLQIFEKPEEKRHVMTGEQTVVSLFLKSIFHLSPLIIFSIILLGNKS